MSGQRPPAFISTLAHALSNCTSQRETSGAVAPSLSASAVAFNTQSSSVPARIILLVLQVSAGSAASAAAAPSAFPSPAAAIVHLAHLSSETGHHVLITSAAPSRGENSLDLTSSSGIRLALLKRG